MAPVEIRYDVPAIKVIEALLLQLLGPSGRAATREKALAVTKLQEAAMWLEAEARLLADPIDDSLLTPAEPAKAVDLNRPPTGRKPGGVA